MECEEHTDDTDASQTIQSPPSSPAVYSTWYSPVISMRSNSSVACDSMVTVFSKSRDVSMSPIAAVAPVTIMSKEKRATKSSYCCSCCCAI